MRFQIKRIYEEPTITDGQRVLIDRLWPRGVSKVKADLTLWLKEAAPSPELRIWFNHEESKFLEFKKKYLQELEEDDIHQEAVRTLLKMGEKGMVTLLYGAKSPTINHAIVLWEYLNGSHK